MSVRIFNNNVLDVDFIANQVFSSEQSAFPASNALNFQRRSKVWRTNGHWEITSSNNTIIFRESTGVDLTATVAVADYTSTSALFTAIKNAMEFVGSSTYTIANDSTTLKIQFTSNGSGGGGIFEIDWTSSSMASVLGFNTSEEDTGALVYLADELKIHTDEYIQFDFGISTLPTAFALIGARNSPIKITPSATIKLQGNETNTWTSPTSDLSVDYDDEVFCAVSTSGLWSEALRYARLQIIDQANVNGFVEIGALFLGTFFEGTRGKAQFPFRGEHVDRSKRVISEGGQTFSDLREKTERFTIDWFGLTVSEKEEIDDLFLQLGTSQPFFVQFDGSTDPLAFSGRKEKYIRYVKFERAPSYELVSPGNFACSMAFLEEL